MAACALTFAFTLAGQTAGQQQKHITTPREALGFVPGDDYRLANYTQMIAWWKKLVTESDRAKLVDIGPTEEGRREYMMIVSSPENMKNLDKYQGIVRRLALAEGLTDAQAHELAREGKSVIWIDGGLHADEIVNSHQLMMLIYEMLTKDDAETMRILNNVILLCPQPNPDGQELVANWYMRQADQTKRTYGDLPKTYNKYVGHDNNRDFYMGNMKETTNMIKVMFQEWFPQIMYNHHQTGPAGAIIATPPFRNPFNYHYDPLIVTELEMVGSALHTRFAAEGKGGFAFGATVPYSTWNNGMQRTITYFHNIIGILTEINGNPTPQDIPLWAQWQLPSVSYPMPVEPTRKPSQQWHFRQAIDYSLTADRAILVLAADNKEMFMYNQYLMGRNSIRRGNTDTWTVTPKRILAMQDAAAGDKPRPTTEQAQVEFLSQFNADLKPGLYDAVLHDPAQRDPRGYIIPAQQRDFGAVIAFVNALIKNGVTVMKATAPFDVAGKHYTAGSYVVKCAQAFRPHILDMFEPQDHPNDFAYPGGPPIRPYDATGWTLAYQMGFQFDRILDGFNGPFAKVAGLQEPPAGKITGAAQPAGYLISHQTNNSFIVVNRLLKAGAQVFWLKDSVAVNGVQQGPGTIYVPASAGALGILQKATALGVSAEGVASRPGGEAKQVKMPRIGLYDSWGGNEPSGWLRYMLDRYEFPVQVVFPQALDAGNLNSRFDVLIFMTGAFSPPSSYAAPQPSVADTPAQYRGMLGWYSADKTLPQLKAFAQAGGTIIGMGDAARIGLLFGMPMSDALTETVNGREQRLPGTKFYIPGAILRVAVDPTDPMAYGMPSEVDVYFQNSQAFQLGSGGSGMKKVVSFPNATPLRSGWAWGQAYLENKVEALSSTFGEGQVYMIGFEPTFRGQPQGTFKLFFNSIFAGSVKPAGGNN